MKTTMKLAWVLLVLLNMTSCNAQENNVNKESIVSETEIITPEPDRLGMDRDTMAVAVKSNSLSSVEDNKVDHVAEGLAAIEATIEARDALQNSETDKAINYIETAVGKLEVLMARNPDVALIPVSSAVRTEEFIGNLETIKAIKSEARKAMEEGDFQMIRDAVAKLGSEVRIETTNIPAATYPQALKMSAAYIEDGNYNLALEAIQTMLNTLVISEQRIPLPIIRAEVLIEEAMNQDSKDADHKDDIYKLLDNAEYQLILAEELGYGKKDVEYKVIKDAILEIRKSVKSDNDSQDLFDKLKSKMNIFKNRISK